MEPTRHFAHLYLFLSRFIVGLTFNSSLVALLASSPLFLFFYVPRSLNICIYIYMCIYIHTHVYIYIYMCVYTYVYILCVFVCACVRVYLHVCTCMQMCKWRDREARTLITAYCNSCSCSACSACSSCYSEGPAILPLVGEKSEARGQGCGRKKVRGRP